MFPYKEERTLPNKASLSVGHEAIIYKNYSLLAPKFKEFLFMLQRFLEGARLTDCV